jgi:hypothetical protein
VGAEDSNGYLMMQSANRWHTFRLTNTGGGASEQWTLEAPEEIKFKLACGNLRREHHLHFQVKSATAGTGTVSRPIKLKGASGSEAVLTVKYLR